MKSIREIGRSAIEFVIEKYDSFRISPFVHIIKNRPLELALTGLSLMALTNGYCGQKPQDLESRLNAQTTTIEEVGPEYDVSDVKEYSFSDFNFSLDGKNIENVGFSYQGAPEDIVEQLNDFSKPSKKIEEKDPLTFQSDWGNIGFDSLWQYFANMYQNESEEYRLEVNERDYIGSALSTWEFDNNGRNPNLLFDDTEYNFRTRNPDAADFAPGGVGAYLAQVSARDPFSNPSSPTTTKTDFVPVTNIEFEERATSESRSNLVGPKITENSAPEAFIEGSEEVGYMPGGPNTVPTGNLLIPIVPESPLEYTRGTPNNVPTGNLLIPIVPTASFDVPEGGYVVSSSDMRTDEKTISETALIPVQTTTWMPLERIVASTPTWGGYNDAKVHTPVNEERNRHVTTLPEWNKKGEEIDTFDWVNLDFDRTAERISYNLGNIYARLTKLVDDFARETGQPEPSRTDLDSRLCEGHIGVQFLNGYLGVPFQFNEASRDTVTVQADNKLDDLSNLFDLGGDQPSYQRYVQDALREDNRPFANRPIQTTAPGEAMEYHNDGERRETILDFISQRSADNSARYGFGIVPNPEMVLGSKVPTEIDRTVYPSNDTLVSEGGRDYSQFQNNVPSQIEADSGNGIDGASRQEVLNAIAERAASYAGRDSEVVGQRPNVTPIDSSNVSDGFVSEHVVYEIPGNDLIQADTIPSQEYVSVDTLSGRDLEAIGIIPGPDSVNVAVPTEIDRTVYPSNDTLVSEGGRDYSQFQNNVPSQIEADSGNGIDAAEISFGDQIDQMDIYQNPSGELEIVVNRNTEEGARLLDYNVEFAYPDGSLIETRSGTFNGDDSVVLNFGNYVGTYQAVLTTTGYSQGGQTIDLPDGVRGVGSEEFTIRSSILDEKIQLDRATRERYGFDEKMPLEKELIGYDSDNNKVIWDKDVA